MLGKIICGALVCPSLYPSKKTDEELAAEGFVPVKRTKHEEREGYIATPVYKYNRTRTAINESWTYEEVVAGEHMEMNE